MAKSKSKNVSKSEVEAEAEAEPGPGPETETGTSAKANAEAEPTFEEALAEVEAIVGQLEAGTADLDTALARYERGVRCLARCRAALRAAERRVTQLLQTGDEEAEPATSAFDDPADGA